MLIGAGVALAAAGGATAVGVRMVRRVKRPTSADLAQVIDGLLADHVPLAPGATMAFAEAYMATIGTSRAARSARLTLGGYLKRRPVRALLSADRARDLRRFERALVSLFLLSTDHFRVPPGTPARFVAFADPYTSGCANPLANLAL